MTNERIIPSIILTSFLNNLYKDDREYSVEGLLFLNRRIPDEVWPYYTPYLKIVYLFRTDETLSNILMEIHDRRQVNYPISIYVLC